LEELMSERQEQKSLLSGMGAVTDPLALFPRDESGLAQRGPFHWIAVDDVPEAVEKGWRPLPVTDKYMHPVVDGRGMLCEWAPTRWQRFRAAVAAFFRVLRKGPMVLP
jgi:hypothetical protein